MKRQMKGRKMIHPELDREANELKAFSKNVEMVDKIRDNYQGNYIAVCDQRVVGYDPEYSNLWSKITQYISEKQLYVSYIPDENEVLVA